MCIIEKLNSKVCRFDGFSFYSSIEHPNYWQKHDHQEIQITIPQTNALAWIDIESSATKQSKRQIEPNRSCIIYPNRPHALEWQQTAGLTLFYLHPEFFASVIGNSIKETNLTNHGCFSPAKDTLILEIASIFYSLCYSKQMGIERLYLENLASLLAVHLLKNYLNYELVCDRSKKLSSKKLKAVFEYIETNLERKITLAELATIAGVGKYYFCRLFKNSINTTPYSYVLHRRIERAKRLLKDYDLPICDIALECGFSNQSHLTKHFRSILGTSPMKYRQNNM